MAAKTKSFEERLEQLEKENAELRKNSVYAPGPYGAAGDYERVQKACQDAAEKGEDPWNVKISVQAPRRGKGDDSYWISVNGRYIQIPADEKYYELALPFAQCLVDLIRAERRSNDFIDNIQVYDPITNPKSIDKIDRTEEK